MNPFSEPKSPEKLDIPDIPLVPFEKKISYTKKNTVISPNFLVYKFWGKHSFRIVLGESPETMRKLYLSTNFHTKKLTEITVFFVVLI